MKTGQVCLAIIVTVGAGLTAVKVWSGEASQGFDLNASIARGKASYNSQCVICHQETGDGVKDVYPPLAKSDYLMADKARSIGIVVNGASGEITVNGVKYDGEMLGVELPDAQVSDVLNYVRNSWGNKGDGVTPEEIAPQRKKK
jgi:mono/diheme cytochrome c family protein